MTILYILGTDGAGKTTLARHLADAPIAGQRLAYLYSQPTPLLIRPLQWIARALFIGKADQFKDYDGYRARKQAAGRRRPWATRLYCLVWYVDFVCQAWFRLLLPRLRGGRIVLDRYYLDQVVNQGVLQANDPKGMLRDARLLERFLPGARLHLYLDVSEETAFKRKDDIQSVSYLRERRSRYLELAPHYGFIHLDANQPADAVYEQAKRVIEAKLPDL